jgi:DNA polymerase I-like protein with 3'-5' exonuclease and polymerase domains
VLVALGETAAQVLTGYDLNITDLHGYVFERDSEHSQWVIPTFHPAFLLRGMAALTGCVAFTIKRALRIAREGFRYEDESGIQEYPNLDDFRAFAFSVRAAGSEARLAVDIETPNTRRIGRDEDTDEDDPSWEVLRVSFAAEGLALSVPFKEPFLDCVRDLLAADNIKVMWNAKYDTPRLERAGFRVRGWTFDAMEGWKRLQAGLSRERRDRTGEEKEAGATIVKPNRLEFVAPFYVNTPMWKHLAHAREAYYNAKDSWATLRAAAGVERDLRAAGMWESFIEDSRKLIPALERIGARGMLIDREAQEVLRCTLQAQEDEALGKLQELVPDQLRNLEPKRKGKDGTVSYGYVRTPKDTSEMQLREFNDGSRWCRVLPFLPNSHDQIKRYMRFRGHAVPRHKRTGADTTEADQLRAMARRYRDETYSSILSYREAHKLTSTYIYKLSDDNRVRTHFKFASTGRLRSYKVNLHNIPKRAEVAAKLRRTFVAPPGFLILEADFAAIEAVMVGYFAHDPQYIELAKKGIHTFLASHILKTPLPLNARAEDIAEIKKRAKATRVATEDVYETAKRTVHGTSYGATPRMIRATYPDHFASEKQAAELQELYFSTMGVKVREWQLATIAEAASAHKLTGPWGDVLWLWDIYKRYSNGDGGDWEWAGEDCKAAIAFRPQNAAARKQRESILALEDERMVLNVHDSLIFYVEAERLQEYARNVRDVMQKPIAQLGGLTVNVELSVGSNWGPLGSDNPQGMTEFSV